MLKCGPSTEGNRFVSCPPKVHPSRCEAHPGVVIGRPGHVGHGEDRLESLHHPTASVAVHLLVTSSIEPVQAVATDVDVSVGMELNALVDALSTAGAGGGHAFKGTDPCRTIPEETVQVKVQLLYFDGCPHWTAMEERLRQALVHAGNSQLIERVLVETPEAADELRFAGSPSILLDGRDPFPTPSKKFGLTCRMYPTPGGPAGTPTVDQLVAAIGEAVGESSGVGPR
jgi:hypothetical protein